MNEVFLFGSIQQSSLSSKTSYEEKEQYTVWNEII